MSGQTDNFIGDQPVTSPSVSDEILYELGYSISPSQEENEGADEVAPKTVGQSELNTDLTSNSHSFNLVPELPKELENSLQKVGSVLTEEEKRFEETDFQIGIDSSVVTYPGHKLKDKKYLQKIKKRKRRKKRTTCSPTKLEAICREMSGLVVSEDDTSTTETSPESLNSEEGGLQQDITNNRNTEDQNDESELMQQSSSEGMQEGHDSNTNLENHCNDYSEHNEDGELTAVSSKEKQFVDVRELSPNEETREIQPSPTGIPQKCSKSDKEDDVTNFADITEMTSTDVNGFIFKSLSNEDTEFESTGKESNDSSVKEPVNSQLSSDLSGNTNVCQEFSYEDLFGNIKKCSIKVRRLSEESIALYTGGSPKKQTSVCGTSEVSYASCSKQPLFLEPPVQSEPLFHEPSAQSAQSENGKETVVGNETEVTETSSGNPKENIINLKPLLVRVRRLSGESIASYTGSAMSPQKGKNKDNEFKVPESPSKLKSNERRRSERFTKTENLSPERKAKKQMPSPSKSVNLKAKVKASNSATNQSQKPESSRSFRGEKLEEQRDNITRSKRGRRSRPGLFESISEINFKHHLKSHTVMKKLEERRNENLGHSKNSRLLENLSDISCKNFLEQIKKCSVSLEKIVVDSSLTKIREKPRSADDKKSSDFDNFKVPMEPKLYLEQKRSGRRTNTSTISLSPGSSSEKGSSPRAVHKPNRKPISLQREAASEINYGTRTSRSQSWQEQFIKSLANKSPCKSPNEFEIENFNNDGSLKRTSPRVRKLSGVSAVNTEMKDTQNKTKKSKKSERSQQESMKASQSSPIKLCSVNIPRLSSSEIARYMNKNVGIFDDIVKELKKRTEKSITEEVVKENAAKNSSSEFLVPTLPVRKRRGSGDTISSLSKWSTRRQPLKTPKPNTRKAPKKKWIDMESVDSESSVRPCSVKLMRLDPDSVSNCPHDLNQTGDSMPNQIVNPALNVSNVDQVVDDELYCLRRFLQVPIVPEPELDVTAVSENISAGKQENPKLKSCSVVLKRITKKQNLKSVNIKKVIAKQLADNVAFSSGSESDHDEEESCMDIDKLLFSLKETTAVNTHLDGPAQGDFLSNQPEVEAIDRSTSTLESTNNRKEDGNISGTNNVADEEITDNLSLPGNGNEDGKKDNGIVDWSRLRAEGSSEDIVSTNVISAEVIMAEDKPAENIVQPLDQENVPLTLDAIFEETKRKCTEKLVNKDFEVSVEVHKNLTETVKLSEKRKPESDIWSDSLPDLDLDDVNLEKAKAIQMKSLSTASVCSTSNSSFKEDGGKEKDTSADLHKDYFNLADMTKKCSVRLEKISVKLKA
ncbi:uncharacterized protein LOC133192006 [Saccostrea echinata]|uniref:uncharacterized protein LOC133192006 n=1 Tax=Saccostrea echinata TaxID=191078 RepID=UPI002A821C41|nr:uncharacterized protein LOC133192006 [Saccostrea echinata]